mmetsp:Transcript_7979/g.20621  ORF Transcript_7979/g.20621 Transcript_7979/m.20621 type:complete len:207 (-) Transcript_7979:620-1240(-)
MGLPALGTMRHKRGTLGNPTSSPAWQSGSTSLGVLGGAEDVRGSTADAGFMAVEPDAVASGAFRSCVLPIGNTGTSGSDSRADGGVAAGDVAENKVDGETSLVLLLPKLPVSPRGVELLPLLLAGEPSGMLPTSSLLPLSGVRGSWPAGADMHFPVPGSSPDDSFIPGSTCNACMSALIQVSREASLPAAMKCHSPFEPCTAKAQG